MEIFGITRTNPPIHIFDFATQRKLITADTDMKARHDLYASELNSLEDTEAFLGLVSDRDFISRHAKAISEWRELWKKLLADCHFTTQFDDFLRSKSIDPTKLLASYEEERKKAQVEPRGSDFSKPHFLCDHLPLEKPTSGSLNYTEKTWIAEWFFGSWAYSGTRGRDSRTISKRLAKFCNVVYYRAWDRGVKKQNRFQGNLGKAMTEIEAIWASESFPSSTQ
jgi:hypothetical protein